MHDYPNAFPVTALAAKLIAVLGFTSIILFLYTFPHGSFAPRWTAWLAIIWIVNDIISVLFPALMQEYAGIGFLSFFIPALGCIGVQIYRYRRVRDPVERQQAKWVVFGIVACFSSLLSFLVIARMIGLEATSPMGLILHPTVLMVCVMAIPISIGMAILKSRLWDIDVVINRALVYGSLTVTLLLVYIGSVVLLQGALRPLVGTSSELATVVSTLAIAALFQPLRRRIQQVIDRRFFHRKYDAEKTLAAFNARLRDEVDLDQLTIELEQLVDKTLHPVHVSVWLRPRQ